MQSDRDLLKQALEALNHVNVQDRVQIITALRDRLAQPEFDSALQSAATTQTAAKLAQPEQWEQFYPDMGNSLDRMAENARELGLDYEPVQEPVAWMYVNMDGECEQIEYLENEPMPDDPSITPLYTTPPRREWQGLTDDEIWKYWWDRPEVPDGEDDSMEAEFVSAVRAIEAKLREKNA